MNQKYGGVIWTNHAIDRLKERGIKQGEALAAFKHPQKSRYAATRGAWVYNRTSKQEKIEVVAKKNDQKEWVILSVWSRPDYVRQREGLVRRIFRVIFGF